MRRELQKSISKRVAPTQLCLSSIFYIREIEFNFSRESKTIKFHTYINLKIVIELQIEPQL